MQSKVFLTLMIKMTCIHQKSHEMMPQARDMASLDALHAWELFLDEKEEDSELEVSEQ